MPNSAQLRAFMEALISRTASGAISWEQDEVGDWVFQGAGGSVELRPVDRSNNYPIRLVVLDASGDSVYQYRIEKQPDGARPGEWFFSLGRELFDAVTNANDPGALLTRELEDLPPF